jgi:hypothetical protein
VRAEFGFSAPSWRPGADQVALVISVFVDSLPGLRSGTPLPTPRRLYKTQFGNSQIVHSD